MDEICLAILKYRKHASVTIEDINVRSYIQISFVSVDEVVKKFKKINPRKAVQSTNVPVRISNDDADIFPDYICGFFNKSINSFKYPSVLKGQAIHPFLRKVIEF